jgi:type IV pilus assembly protein PilN
MIRINLLPREERAAAPTIKLPQLGAMAPLGILGAVLLIVAGTAVAERAKVHALQNDVAEIKEEVRAIQPQVDRVKRLTAQREELEARLGIIQQLDRGRFLSVRVMDDMARQVPRYMWLTSLQQQGPTSLKMGGVTFSNLIVAEFMMRLEQSPLFSNIDLVETKRGQIDERDVMEFTLTATLTPDEVPTDLTADALLEGLLEETEQ